ncbi:MAG: galactokinase, partial [Kiritimatiellia bacterium]
MQTLQNELIAKFSAHFAREPEIISYAPGRIEVLGNHTDYNEGYVLSAAINYGTFFAVSKRADNKVRLLAGDIMEEVVFDVNRPVAEKESMWANYVKGCLAGVSSIKTPPFGFDAAFLGNIPLGSGLSSSAALETCATLAIARLFGLTLSKLEVAKIGQKAEHTYAGVKCGLLDQVS